jgi:hypothetical protein
VCEITLTSIPEMLWIRFDTEPLRDWPPFDPTDTFDSSRKWRVATPWV